MFTIGVKKRGKDEKFSFKDLEMYHQECLGGKIQIESKENRLGSGGFVAFYELTCSRCERQICLDKSSDLPAMVIMTAIDGKERKGWGFVMERREFNYLTQEYLNFTVIQKT